MNQIVGRDLWKSQVCEEINVKIKEKETILHKGHWKLDEIFGSVKKEYQGCDEQFL